MRVRLTSSLQARLLLAVGVLAVAAIVAVALSARLTTRREFERFQQVERGRVSDDPPATLARINTVLAGRCCAAGVVADAGALLASREAMFVLDDTGAVVAAAGFELAASELRITKEAGALHLEGGRAGSSVVSGLSLLIRGVPETAITLQDGRAATLYVLKLPIDRNQPAAEFLGSLDRRLIAATALVAVLALGLSFMVTRRIVRPIAELRDAALDLARGRLSRRVTTRGRDEIAELGHGFNTMAAELERQQTLRRNLVHDVAHELRTPLTALRCRIEAAIDGVTTDPAPAFAQMHEEVAHLSQLVSDLDDLARAEAGDIALARTSVRISDVCRSAVRAAGLEGDARLSLALDETATAWADPGRVRQIVLNLLTNADRHAPPGATITVRTSTRGGEAGEAIVEVHNTGSALPASEPERVFDRFYRGDPSRQRATGGTGLGLAIVKHLTEAQSGRVWATGSAEGVTFGLAFPNDRSRD